MKKFFSIISTLLVLVFLPAETRAFSEEFPAELVRDTEYQAMIPVKVIKKIKLPSGYHEGLYFDGKDMWLANGQNGKIWVMDLSDGFVKSEIEPIGSFAEAITSPGDGTYWYTDWDTKKIYRVKIAGGKMEPVYDIALEPSHPAGLAWTGSKLFMITWTRSMAGTKFHLLQLDENEKMFRKMEIKRIQEPAHMAWDGKNLWITSWFSQLVYKVDIVNYKVVGSFRSPASETTGIAWDGKYFWVTGTSADLYQIQVGDGNSKQ